MPQFIAEHVKKLWGTWNVRGLIILSLLLQSFLSLSAQLRKRQGGKWFIMIPLWIAYQLADWAATFTIGLMLRAERSDILAFWAPFLLLHLGGPDTITSFSLEDNEFWIRHLLGLILQVGSTVYVILQSLTHNELWLPTLLVLIAGVIKYAERNCAFYLASFDHFGNNWAYLSFGQETAMPPIPVQFELAHESRFKEIWKRERLNMMNPEHYTEVQRGLSSAILEAACTIGTIKSLLVGPPMTKEEQKDFCYFMRRRDSHGTLRTIEIQLSILYELLHTKLPVVDSKIGYVCRMVTFGCILGALLSFSILLGKYNHNKLGEFDIWLTYVLLFGALALDLISIGLLMSSDWVIVWQYPNRKNYDKLIDSGRWSNLVPQLNIADCRFNNKDGHCANKLVDFLGTRYETIRRRYHPVYLDDYLVRRFETIGRRIHRVKLVDFLGTWFETIRRRIKCVSSKIFEERQAWEFIFKTLQEKSIGVAGSEIFGPSRILTGQINNFAWTWKKFGHMDRLLIWHIATEICYQKECSDNSPNNRFDYRKICNLISDYMFYLLVMEPSMTATSPNSLKIAFDVLDEDKKWKWPSYFEKGYKETFTKDLGKLLEVENEGDDLDLGMLKEDVDKLEPVQNEYIARFSRINAARLLAKELLNQRGGCPWELMGRFWVEILCYAAIKCQPIVHARQVSKGGQFLTLVWLLINYLGLTPPSMNPESIAFDEVIASVKRKARSIPLKKGLKFELFEWKNRCYESFPPNEMRHR